MIFFYFFIIVHLTGQNRFKMTSFNSELVLGQEIVIDSCNVMIMDYSTNCQAPPKAAYFL